MEHESFENEAIAALMNAHFVCIKVDREERPDLDQIYMNAVQLMTRRGGWPMSVFLTPELKPFYGGTYWPPESGRGMPGFREILGKVHEAWISQRKELKHSAEELTAAVREIASQISDRTGLDESLLRRGMRRLISIADRRYGGFGGAPRFPHSMDVPVARCCGNGSAMPTRGVSLTLDKMAGGGMRNDHLGGGFTAIRPTNAGLFRTLKNAV